MDIIKKIKVKVEIERCLDCHNSTVKDVNKSPISGSCEKFKPSKDLDNMLVIPDCCPLIEKLQ